MHKKNKSTAGANSGSSSSMSLNIGGILNNAFLQPLTQTKMKSNLTFNKTNSSASGAKGINMDGKDPREQYYYEEEYDDEVIDLESRTKADPPIRKVRTVQNPYQSEEILKAVNSDYSDGAENQAESDEDTEMALEFQRRQRNNSAVDKWGVRNRDSQLASVSERRKTEKVEKVKVDEYVQDIVYEGDPPEMKKEDFREAIFMEWRERTEELKKQNEEISDKDDHTRYEHPSILKFQKATPKLDRSVVSMEMSFAGDSASHRESLLSIRKRFTDEESIDFDSNLNSSPQASREYLQQLKPYKSKYKHLFAVNSQMSDVSKVEIEFILKKQLQKGLCGDDELNFDETNENSFTMDDRDEDYDQQRKSHGMDADGEMVPDGETHTPLLLDKLTSRLSQYYQLNQLLAKTLKYRCHEQSNKFDAGMNRITNVLAGVNDLKQATQMQKQRLRNFKNDMSAQILKVSLMRLKQQRLREIQQLMQKVIGKYSVQVLQQVYENINSGNFIDALDLIRNSLAQIHIDFQQAMPAMKPEQIHKITVVNLVITRLSQAEECIWKILSHSLQNFCLGHPFSSEQYSQIFQCYSKYGYQNNNAKIGTTSQEGIKQNQSLSEQDLKQFCELLQQKFDDGLNRTVQIIANRIIMGGKACNPYGDHQKNSIDQGSNEGDDRVPNIDDLLYSVRDCYIAVCRVLYNHHMIVRWHHNAEMEPKQKQWLTNQLLHIQRPTLVTQVDKLVTISIIAPLRMKISYKDPNNNKDGLMPLQKVTQFLALTGLLAKILSETSHQATSLNIIEATNNQIMKSYVEKMEKGMIEDFREVLECVEAFERMPVKEGFDIWGKDRDELALGTTRVDLLEVFKGPSGLKPNSSVLAQFVHRNPFIETMPNPKVSGKTQSQKQQVRLCQQFLQQLIKPNESLDSIHDEHPFLKLGLAKLNSQNLMKLDQLQNQNLNFYNIDEDEFDNSDDASNDSDCLDSSEDEEQTGSQMIHQSASSRPSAPYQTLSRVFGSAKKANSEMKDWSSDDVIMSISGLSLIRTVLLRHLSMMRNLRSHSYEVFVSFSQCVRFYGHVVSAVFIHSDTYQQILNDVVIYGAAYSQQAKQTGMFTITDREKSRVCRLVHFQSRYSHLKQLIVQGLTWVDDKNMAATHKKDKTNQRRSQTTRQEINIQNLRDALGQNADDCELAQIQKQTNGIFYRSATDYYPPEINRIQLFLKQIVALHQLKLIEKVMNSPMPTCNSLSTSQSQVFDLKQTDSNGQSQLTIRETIKELLAPNTQQVTYALNFFEDQAQFNENLKELLVRQGLKMLLFPQQNKEQKQDPDQRHRKSIDADKALEGQFSQIGQNIINILGNVPHSHKWSGVERRTEPSGYVNKLLEQIKDFEYKMSKLCSMHHLPAISILMDHLWQLWDMIACDLIEQYSLISSVDAAGRQNMISDVDYILKLCNNIFKSTQPPEVSGKGKKKQEVLNVPPMMLALRDYLQSYFLDLTKLLNYSKKNMQTSITYEQLKRLYRVHPLLQPDQKPTEKPKVKQSFFKKLTSKQSTEVQPKDVQDFFKNIEAFYGQFFSEGIRQEDLNEHPGAQLQTAVTVSGLMS